MKGEDNESLAISSACRVAGRLRSRPARSIEQQFVAGGKLVDNTTIVWQNIVKSAQQPIESGKTYQDLTTLDPGTAKAECSLKEVIFKDGTSWSAR